MTRFFPLFIIFTLISGQGHPALIQFNPSQKIKASEINSNFSYIKSILQERNIALNFTTFQSGQVIKSEEFEAEFNKVRALNIEVTPLNLMSIKSSEINMAFSQMVMGSESANDIPVTSNLSFLVAEDSQYLGVVPFNNVVGNTTLIITSMPTHGLVIPGPNGSFSYTPELNYSGSDTFSYKINDGLVDSNISTASISVTPVNDAPTAHDKNISLNEDNSVTVTLSGSDIENSSLTYEIVTYPSKGSLSGSSPNLTYFPALNENGTDSFSYRVYDGELYSEPAIVNLTINPVNDAPILNSYSPISLAHNATHTGNFSVTDIDSSSFSYIVTQSPVKGSISINNSGEFTYSPTNANYGSDTFKLKVNDGFLDSSEITVNVLISCAVNFHEEGFSCVSNTRSCPIVNGVGQDTYNVNTNSWNNSCQVVSCSNGTIPGSDNGSCIFVEASGGTISYDGDYKIHTFSSSSNLIVSKVSPSHSIEYLIVGGGGSGSFGGGGGGGVKTNSGLTLSAQTYPVVVGAGGAAGLNGAIVFDSVTGNQYSRASNQEYFVSYNSGTWRFYWNGTNIATSSTASAVYDFGDWTYVEANNHIETINGIMYYNIRRGGSGTKGGSSSFAGIISDGGGYGGRTSPVYVASSGASGGGGGGLDYSGAGGVNLNPSSMQGNIGGIGTANGAGTAGGGGGGGGAATPTTQAKYYGSAIFVAGGTQDVIRVSSTSNLVVGDIFRYEGAKTNRVITAIVNGTDFKVNPKHGVSSANINITGILYSSTTTFPGDGGDSPNSSTGGGGGQGRLSSISGTPVYYGSGGGGGAYVYTGTGTAGLGGNGAGNGGRNGIDATSGAANRGGGGGGFGLTSAGHIQGTAGSGGSGVVIIRYRYK